MFNRNQFTDWAKNAQQKNSSGQDYHNSQKSPQLFNRAITESPKHMTPEQETPQGIASRYSKKQVSPSVVRDILSEGSLGAARLARVLASKKPLPASRVKAIKAKAEYELERKRKGGKKLKDLDTTKKKPAGWKHKSDPGARPKVGASLEKRKTLPARAGHKLQRDKDAAFVGPKELVGPKEKPEKSTSDGDGFKFPLGTVGSALGAAAAVGALAAPAAAIKHTAFGVTKKRRGASAAVYGAAPQWKWKDVKKKRIAEGIAGAVGIPIAGAVAGAIAARKALKHKEDESVPGGVARTIGRAALGAGGAVAGGMLAGKARGAAKKAGGWGALASKVSKHLTDED